MQQRATRVLVEAVLLSDMKDPLELHDEIGGLSGQVSHDREVDLRVHPPLDVTELLSQLESAARPEPCLIRILCVDVQV